VKPGLGILIGLPVAAILALICVVLGIWAARVEEYGLAVGGAVAFVIVVAAAAVFFWPYQKEYHWWQPVEGYVERIDSRILPAGDRQVEQKFVVKLVGIPHPYGIQDTRAALLKKGDHVSLSCIRKWQFGSGDHGYDCRWGAYGEAG